MELKRILARDSRAANEKAIQLYGKEVLVISNQKVDGQIELVVAVDVAPAEVTRCELGLESQEQNPGTSSPGKFGKFFQEAQLEPLPEEPEIKVIQPAARSAGASEDLNDGFGRSRSQEIVDLLRSEISNLREELLLSVRGRMSVGHHSQLSPEAQGLMNALAEAGMPVSMQLLLESALLKAGSAAEANSITSAALLKTMTRPPCLPPCSGKHALIGPSGAGKTLMTARLAQMAAAENGAELQALISYQDTRPGAWAQIQVLASQIGVDCFRAQDLHALKVVLDDLGPRRTVWVDTGSINFMATAQELTGLGLNIHAVLPVDATITNVRKIMLEKTQQWASLLLSKTDEATPSWALIKGLCETDLPITGIADSTSISRAALRYDPSLLLNAAMASAGLQGVAKTAKTSRTGAAVASVRTRKSEPSRKVKAAPSKAVHG